MEPMQIPEFLVTKRDGMYIANWCKPLSPIEVDWGCKDRIIANDWGELEMRCCAQRIIRTMIEATQRMRVAARPYAPEGTDGLG